MSHQVSRKGVSAVDTAIRGESRRLYKEAKYAHGLTAFKTVTKARAKLAELQEQCVTLRNVVGKSFVSDETLEIISAALTKFDAAERDEDVELNVTADAQESNEDQEADEIEDDTDGSDIAETEAETPDPAEFEPEDEIAVYQ
jgi:hypothetical protein